MTTSLVHSAAHALVLEGDDTPFAHAEVVRTRYRPSLDMAEHSHEKANVSLVLEGAVREQWGRCTHEVDALSLVFKPPRVPHSDRASTTGARCLIIGFASAADLPAFPFACTASRLTVLALEIGQAALGRDSAAMRLRLDELSVALAEHVRAVPAEPLVAETPRWLRRVHDAVVAGEVTRLAQAAELAGVPPWHGHVAASPTSPRTPDSPIRATSDARSVARSAQRHSECAGWRRLWPASDEATGRFIW